MANKNKNKNNQEPHDNRISSLLNCNVGQPSYSLTELIFVFFLFLTHVYMSVDIKVLRICVCVYLTIHICVNHCVRERERYGK